MIQVINGATYVVPTNHCRDFSRQNEVAGRLQVGSIEDLWDGIFKIFELIFLRLYLAQGVADTLYPFRDLRLCGLARQEVSQVCYLGQRVV